MDRLVFPLIAVLALLLAAWLWLHPRTEVRVEKEFVPVEKVKEVERVPRAKVKVSGGAITALDKPALANAIGLPGVIVNDSSAQVVAVGRVDCDDHKETVLAVTNTESGETSLLTRSEPQPLAGIPNKWEFGLEAGPTTADNWFKAVDVTWTPLRIKSGFLSLKLMAFQIGDSSIEGAALLRLSGSF